jgi:Family of unknown function (DUF5755)
MNDVVGVVLCSILVLLSVGFLVIAYKNFAVAPRLGQSSRRRQELRQDYDQREADDIDYRHPLPPGPVMPLAPPSLFLSPPQPPQPLRNWLNPPEFPPRGGIATIPINIPTQGLPEQFGTVGVIEVDGDVWPLYGRRTGGSSDRWNYYTRNNTYNPVPLPIKYQRRDCMDDVGCQELLSGENVKIGVLGKEGKATLYRADGPKYIPGLM